MPPLDHTLQRTYELQRQNQTAIALDHVLRLARLLTQAPREDVSPAVGVSLEALREALATYAFWTQP